MTKKKTVSRESKKFKELEERLEELEYYVGKKEKSTVTNWPTYTSIFPLEWSPKTEPITIKEKVDSIIKHLGLSIYRETKEEKVVVKAPEVKTEKPKSFWERLGDCCEE